MMRGRRKRKDHWRGGAINKKAKRRNRKTVLGHDHVTFSRAEDGENKCYIIVVAICS